MRRLRSYGLLSVSAFLLRFVSLGREALWYDEAYTGWVAGLPFLRLMAAQPIDLHPPLWHLIEHLSISLLGQSPMALRLPAALAGTACVVLLVMVGRAVGLERWAWLAGGLYALMPAAVYYGREARMYSLLTAWVLLAAWAILRRRRWLLAASLAGLLWTHSAAPLYVIALGLAALLSGRPGQAKTALRDNARFWLPAGGLGVAAWLPWLTALPSQVANVLDGFWVPPVQNVGAALIPLYFVTWGVRLPELYQFHAAILAISLTVGGLTLWQWWRGAGGRVVVCLAFLPALLALLVSAAWQPIYHNRTLVPSGAFISLIWAAGLAHSGKNTRAASLALLVPLLGLGLYGNYIGQRQPEVAQAEVIKENWRPGDAVYHFNSWSQVVFGYVLPAAQYPQFLRPSDDHLDEGLAGGTKDLMGFRQSSPEATGADRLWVVWSSGPFTPDAETEAIGDLLHSHPAQQVAFVENNPLTRLEIWLVDMHGPVKAKADV